MSDPAHATLDEMANECGGLHEPPMQEDFPHQHTACEVLDSVASYDDLIVLLASARASDPALYEAVLLRIEQVEGAAAVGWVEMEVAAYGRAAEPDAPAAGDGGAGDGDGAEASTREGGEQEVELDLSAIAEGREEMGPKYFRRPVMKPGRVAKASPYLALREKPLPGAEYLAEPGAQVEALHFEDEVFVLAELEGDWYEVSSTKSGKRGFVAKWTIRTDPPEPAAGLFAVEENDTLIGIAEAHYGDQVSKGQDLRFYVFALLYANEGAAGLYKASPSEMDWSFQEAAAYVANPEQMAWKLWGCKSGHVLWVPSAEFANQLKGKIPDGTLTDGNWAALKEGWDELKKAAVELAEWAAVGGAFIAGLPHGALESLWDLAASIPELGDMLVDIFDSLIRGDLLGDAETWWDEVSSIDGQVLAEHIDEGLRKKWNDPNFLVRGHFIGWITGYAVMELVMMGLSGGAATAIKWTGKAGTFSRLLSTLGRGRAVLDKIDNLADTNKAVAKAKKLVGGKKKKPKQAEVDGPDAKKKLGAEEGGDPKKKDAEAEKKKRDEDESKPQGLANKAARLAFEAAAKPAETAIREKKDVLADAKRGTKRLAKPGVTIDFDLVATGSAWAIRAAVKKGDERAKAKHGKGWIATGKSATKGGSESSKWYVAKDQRALHERLIADLDAELETEASKLVESGKEADLKALKKGLDSKVKAAEKAASSKMVKGIEIEVDEAAVKEGTDDAGEPALVYPYEVAPNAKTGKVTVSTSTSVSLEPTIDLKHPWLASVPVTDLGPYKFLPRARTFSPAFSLHEADFEAHDRAKLWEAVKESTTYEVELLEWEGDRKSDQVSAGQFKKRSAPSQKMKKARSNRITGARKNLSPHNDKWLDAILGHDGGDKPAPLTSLTDHEAVEGPDGHTLDLHVIGHGRVTSTRDLARRAAFDYIKETRGDVASAYRSIAEADAEAGRVATSLTADWKAKRNQILLANPNQGKQAVTVSTSGTPAGSLLFRRATSASEQDKPEYLGLGSGVRPLFADDVSSDEWQAWEQDNGDRADPTSPVCEEVAGSGSTAYVRGTASQTTGGWLIKTMFPHE